MFKQTFKRFSQKTKVTFVGLGNMGYPMAQNLVNSGKYLVTGFDSNQEVTQKFQKEGGEKTNSLQTSLENSQVLITMVPNGKVVRDVWTQAANYAKKGTYFLNTSTISPIEQKEINKEIRSKGFIPSDCPVSGGVMGAQKATLSFMIGCEGEDKYNQIKEYLTPMGKNFFYCGGDGSGQIAKICNNLCLGITMVGLSESLALGVKLGIDPKILSNIMGVSSARCWSIDTYNPIPGVMENTPAARNYDNGFSNELISKDIKIALDCAKDVGLDAKLSEDTIQHYEKLRDMGFSAKDFSLVYQYILNNKNIDKIKK